MADDDRVWVASTRKGKPSNPVRFHLTGPGRHTVCGIYIGDTMATGQPSVGALLALAEAEAMYCADGCIRCHDPKNRTSPRV